MSFKQIPGKMIEVDMETGEETVLAMSWHIMPPAAHLCQTCGADHPEGAPHNRQSLYYQTVFHAEHGRTPTWEDAMAHCNDDVKQLTIETLEENGVDWRRKGEA